MKTSDWNLAIAVDSFVTTTHVRQCYNVATSVEINQYSPETEQKKTTNLITTFTTYMSCNRRTLCIICALCFYIRFKKTSETRRRDIQIVSFSFRFVSFPPTCSEICLLRVLIWA